MGESHALAMTIWVPRFGRIDRVDVRSIDELRLVRTELELLRGITAWLRSDPFIGRQHPSHVFSAEDRYELRLIRLDANHPIVDESISTIDRRHRTIRKETMMSVIDEEAKNIAQEIAATDSVTAEDATSQQDSVSELEAVTDALATAESELARVTGEVAQASAPESPEAPATPPQAAELPDAASTPDNAEPVPMIEIPPTDDVEALADSAGQPVESTPPPDATTAQPIADQNSDTLIAPAVDEATISEPIEADDPEASSTPSGVTEACVDPDEVEAIATTSGPPVVEVVVDPLGDSSTSPESVPTDPTPETGSGPTAVEVDTNVPDASPSADAAIPSTVGPTGAVPTPDASKAVGEIEQGIRKLADMLSQEVNEQWIQAREALKDVVSARAEMEKSSERTRQMLSDIERIQGEAQVARAETELVRQETRLLREDAERSKQRAEHSAKVAELAADQANNEARSMLREQSPTG